MFLLLQKNSLNDWFQKTTSDLPYETILDNTKISLISYQLLYVPSMKIAFQGGVVAARRYGFIFTKDLYLTLN
jgi:hypothetical protein